MKKSKFWNFKEKTFYKYNKYGMSMSYYIEKQWYSNRYRVMNIEEYISKIHNNTNIEFYTLKNTIEYPCS